MSGLIKTPYDVLREMIEAGKAMASVNSLGDKRKVDGRKEFLVFQIDDDGVKKITHLYADTQAASVVLGPLVVCFQMDLKKAAGVYKMEDNRLLNLFRGVKDGWQPNRKTLVNWYSKSIIKNSSFNFDNFPVQEELFPPNHEIISSLLVISDEEWQQLVTLTKQKIAEDATATPSASAST